jgi:hypothetical protein
VLLKQAALEGIANGTVTAAFRRWVHPRVKAGSTFRTYIGVVAVESVEPITESAITDRLARDAGFASRGDLLAELALHDEGRLYRISLRLAGPDPREALRRRSDLSPSEVSQLRDKLAQFGARTEGGPWALPILRLIAARPGVRAPELAMSLGMKTEHFKPRVRQLKELGLTESLEVGYRLSPRGEAFMRQLQG